MTNSVDDRKKIIAEITRFKMSYYMFAIKGSKIDQNCPQVVLKNCRHGGGGCQKSGKIFNVVYEVLKICVQGQNMVIFRLRSLNLVHCGNTANSYLIARMKPSIYLGFNNKDAEY